MPRLIQVSPRHHVALSDDYMSMIDTAPREDFVVRTLARRNAGATTLMMGELVIAGAASRDAYPLARQYPLHFRKTYYPGRLHGDPRDEFDRQTRASEIIGVPPPIGHAPTVFRTCLLPGVPYSTLSPFAAEPEEANIPKAHKLPLGEAAGLWSLAASAFAQITKLHAAGLS